jgi:P27 family predicted phage terminase small subunit
MDRRDELVARLANDGWVLYTDKGYAYQHPAAGMLATLEDQIRKWLSLLGLTPADRSRLGVAEVKARSKLEEMRERATAGRRSS